MTYAAPLFVTAEFMNAETGEIKSQTVFMGDFPLMTERGTFIINGTERVVVSQLVRSPGVYFERTPDKTSDKDIYSTKVIPSRGAWLEFEVDKRDMVGVRVDRKRKQSVTVLLKALGMTSAEILEEFGDYESMNLTLEKDHLESQDQALLDLYRKLRQLGVEKPERETFESSLRIGRETLELLGLDAYEAREKADTFRRYNLKMLEDTLENYQDTEFRIASLQRAKEMLSAAIEQDQNRLSRVQQTGWRGSIDGKAPEDEVVEAKG